MTTASIPADWEVPQIFRDRLGDQVGRQRTMSSGGHLLLVLHEPPVAEQDERRGRFFWRDPSGTWTSNLPEEGAKALNKHLSEYAERIDHYEEQDRHATSAADYFSVLSALAPLRRAARNMYQALQQAREKCPEDRDLINHRDRAYHLERIAELLYSDARSSLDFHIAQQAENQAKTSYQMSVSSHRLNMLAAFFFPLATLSALFGTNLIHGWEQIKTVDDLLTSAPPSVPFLLVLAVGILLGFILKSIVGRRAPEEPGL